MRWEAPSAHYSTARAGSLLLQAQLHKAPYGDLDLNLPATGTSQKVWIPQAAATRGDAENAPSPDPAPLHGSRLKRGKKRQQEHVHHGNISPARTRCSQHCVQRENPFQHLNRSSLRQWEIRTEESGYVKADKGLLLAHK